MNDPEVIMLVPDTGLAVHRKSLEAAGVAIRLVAKVHPPFRTLADQDIRSAASVNDARAEAALALFDEVRAMRWRLLRPRD